MLCVCDRCVVSCEIVTFDIWTTLIKRAVKLTMFVQFRWKLVWMCMNGTEYYTMQVLGLVAGQRCVRMWSVCIRCEIVTFDTWPHPH